MSDKSPTYRSRDIDKFLISQALPFIAALPEEIDGLMESSLAAVADFTGADRCYIYQFEDKNQRITLTHLFQPAGVKFKIPHHEQVNSEDFAWFIQAIRDQKSLKISSPQTLPENASTIRAIMQVEATCSSLLSPLLYQQTYLGFLGLDTVRGEMVFGDETEYLLKRAAELYASAINRKNRIDSSEQQEQRFRTLFSSIEDVVFISTPHGRFLEINPAGAKLFGYSSVDDMLAVDITAQLYVNPADREKYLETLQTKGQVNDYELLLQDKNKKKLIVLVTASLLRNKEGEITGYQGILRDVTYKRQLERQLFQAKKMESIGMMAGGIAHDFNNILTVINGFAELTLMDMDPSHKHYEDVENIMKGVKRAEELIRQLLAFSRKQMIEPEVIDINGLITELHAMLKRLIPEDIRFDLELQPDISLIKADPVQIQQVLVNLVVNAGRAIKKQKAGNELKTIGIVTRETQMTRELLSRYPGCREGTYVTISVEDSGIGIDEETKQNIFEPFFSTSKEEKGTGLGLSTVYGIVKQNNGYIYVESQPGKGSTFQIFWPATDEQKTPESKVESYLKLQPHHETLLFVEDDAHLRGLMCTALKKFGYQVVEAENGKQALDIVRKKALLNKIDLVISDIVMPEMGGEELAGQLRRLRPNIKILLSSGFSDSRISAPDTLGKNPYYFISKPYRIKKLEKTIRMILTGQA